eukprot:TRINITY_DN1499_c0_g1_i1.p1 TRINITY_DN1499_c0_g1~~TRINITY_DN1499_c0_g1_i1.p1  ORF type:complete len:462 (+),score=116.95 TRINITY_DN1499_c0_g1_i1:201-1388(+)
MPESHPITSSSTSSSPILPSVSPSSPTEEDPESGEGDFLQVGNTKTKKKQQRRANQNLASREYRKRKRERLEELEDTVARLTKELERVSAENLKLRQVDISDLMSNNQRINASLVECRQILTNVCIALRDPTSDDKLVFFLRQFWANVERVQHAVTLEIDKLVNPASQAKLAMGGYGIVNFENPVMQSFPAASWWGTFVQEARVTQEQLQSIQRIMTFMLPIPFYLSILWYIPCSLILASLVIKETTLQTEVGLFAERQQLDRDIKQFYFHTARIACALTPGSESESSLEGLSMQPTPIGYHDMLEFSKKMTLLKNNFVSHRKVILNAHIQIGQQLTPRQQAMLLVRAYAGSFCQENIETLRKLYKSVNMLEAQVIPELEAHMIPTLPIYNVKRD